MTRHSEILVIGAGPSGLAAATEAANAGAQVTVLDENAAPGGQVWRPSLQTPQNAARKRQNSAKARSLAAFYRSGATLLPGRRVIDLPYPGVLQTVTENASQRIENFSWDRLVLATGARERFLPFPGWTLPGVFGAGGLQALVQGGFPVIGKRILVAGTGPLLLAVASHLQEAGAEIVAIAEQASLRQLLPFAIRLASHPFKLAQAARYRATLARVPYRTGCWPIAAEGLGSVTTVRLTDGRRTWLEPCELLACGFHLVPNTELASLLGCAFDGDFVAVDEYQRTSLPNIFCAGEPSGIGGLEAASIKGRVAGLAAAQIEGRNHSRQKKESAFAASLASAFALRPELRSLPSRDTIVCRCEDVRYAQLEGHSSITSWTDAKLQTRCGMGPCQGRICGPVVQALFGWRTNSVRPPLFPVPVVALCSGVPETQVIPSSQEIPCTGPASCPQ